MVLWKSHEMFFKDPWKCRENILAHYILWKTCQLVKQWPMKIWNFKGTHIHEKSMAIHDIFMGPYRFIGQWHLNSNVQMMFSAMYMQAANLMQLKFQVFPFFKACMLIKWVKEDRVSTIYQRLGYFNQTLFFGEINPVASKQSYWIFQITSYHSKSIKAKQSSPPFGRALIVSATATTSESIIGSCTFLIIISTNCLARIFFHSKLTWHVHVVVQIFHSNGVILSPDHGAG